MKEIFISITVLILIILFFCLVWKWALISEIQSKELLIAFIGFMGAIIGGFITLLGVKMTIRNQYREDFFKSYPEKRKAALYLEHTFMSKIDDYQRKFDSDDLMNVQSTFLEIISQEDSILEKAAKVSSEVFDLAFKLIFQMKSLQKKLAVTMNPAPSKEGIVLHLSYSIPREEVQDYLRRMQLLMSELLSETDKINIEYSKLQSKGKRLI